MAPQVLEELRATLEKANANAELAIWPEAWHALQLFLGMQTQWRLLVNQFTGAMRWEGLRYGSLPLVMAATRPRVPAECRQPLHELMRQLQLLEITAAAWKNAH